MSENRRAPTNHGEDLARVTMTLEETVAAMPGAGRANLAFELIEIALPAWVQHTGQHPEDLEAVSALIDDAHRAPTGARIIVSGILSEIVSALRTAVKSGQDLKSNRLLKSYLATVMQPLTNPAWEDKLTPPLRLIFTSVFNLLTALIYRRATESGESHIYVSINQSCDAILQLELRSLEKLQAIIQKHAQSGDDGAADPLVQEDNLAIEGGGDFYSGFLNSFKREYCRCPVCGSTRIQKTPVGIEFTGMYCESCGNNDPCLDVYQLDEWYV